LLALALLLLPAGGGTHAAELLVMPYACTMVGGRPLLSPGPEQSHRIIGRREQRTFAACSPVNPDMCRHWTVHRFEVDCDGARVPWITIVEAAAERAGGRAWVEDGRLRLRMSPRWSFPPGDPCARRPGLDDRHGSGRMRRYCAERQAMAPPAVVDMPAGFAPMLGIDGIFVRTSAPADVSAPPPAPPAVADWTAKTARPEPAEPPRPEAAARPAPEEPPAPVAKPAPPPMPRAAPPPAPKVAAPSPDPGGPVIPKIINRPDAATDPAPPAQADRDVATKAVPKQETAQKAAAPAPRRSGTDQAAAPKLTPGEESVTVNLLSYASRSPVTSVLTAFTGFTLILLAGLVVARRRAHVRRAVRRPARTIAPAPPDRARRTAAPAAGGVALHAGSRPVPARDPLPLPEPATAREPPAWHARMPQTRIEALQVLGMGVLPDTGETAIKKIVDGLRLSWHPDLARDEPDRRLREHRLKQINAAWEIIQGKRAVV
jgi:hypothetical protein